MTSTSNVDSTYSATQTVVTFLTQTSDTTLASSQRVFDFEISSQAQAIYSTLMDFLFDHNVDTSHPDNYLKSVTQILAALNTWSQMKRIANGQQISNASIQIQVSDPAIASLLSTAFGDQTYATTDAATGARGAKIFDATTGILTVDSTMSRYMAEQLDTLVRTMRAAGWDPIYNPYTTQAIGSPLYNSAMDALFSTHSGTTYTPETTYGIYDIIQKAINAAASAPIVTDASTQSQSLQELLMVDYVVRGNELLYGEMDSLNSAINVNQTTLAYLNSLQDLLNQKDPQHFLMQLQCLSNLDESAYSTFEEQTFGSQKLGTTAKFTDDELEQYVLNLRMKAYGVDPSSTDPIVLAQYGQSDDFTNLMAVMDYNISNGAISSSGTVAGGGLDPTSTAVQNQFCLTQADVYTYQNAIVPALRAWYAGTAQYAPTGYSSSDTTALKTWLGDHRVQGYYGISSFTDTVINMIGDGKASFTVGTNQLNASAADLTAYGLGPSAATDFGSLCDTQSSANPTLDRYAMSQAFMTYLITDNMTHTPGGGDISERFFNEDGTINPNCPIPKDELWASSSHYYETLCDTVAKIGSDGKDFNDAAIQNLYGLSLKATTGSTTPSGTAADAFTNSATNSLTVSLAQIQTNLQNLINQATAVGGDASSLVSALNVILTDFKNVSNVSEWVADYDTIGNEGNYQRHMNDAITASQAFNDTERENLRRVMFVYEEFYKSATAMLDKLNTIIEKMGSAIKG